MGVLTLISMVKCIAPGEYRALFLIHRISMREEVGKTIACRRVAPMSRCQLARLLGDCMMQVADSLSRRLAAAPDAT